ncbi:PLDc N-terminal domain-containing protein [Psychromicrobium sp. YIM B11713]|uniref:PLDc N-terminal domain-containing protein n=1 Tax=Psychromicrobium sp. YIM B11713 TaxID=3145233 RepID=UPI00374E6B64
MDAEINPLVPNGWDAGLLVLGLVQLVLLVWAWLSIARSSIPAQFKLLWALLALILPVFGSLIWLAGRRRWQQGSLPRS